MWVKGKPRNCSFDSVIPPALRAPLPKDCDLELLSQHQVQHINFDRTVGSLIHASVVLQKEKETIGYHPYKNVPFTDSVRR